MEYQHRESNRVTGYDYSQQGAYFVTICTLNRRKILSDIVGTSLPGCPNAPIVRLLPFGVVAEWYIRQMDAFYENLSVDKYVIMPDHIHLLISLHDSSPSEKATKPDNRGSLIPRFVGTLKRFCNKEYGQNIWQGRYYDHVIRNQQDYNEVWEYIDNNPIKWAMTKK